MTNDSAVTDAMSPRSRERTGIPLLLLGLFGVPLIWGIRLVANFALASHFCFPGDLRRHALPESLGWVWPAMIGINALSILAAIAVALVCYRSWRTASDESGGARSGLMQSGEGRTRFLSIWGLLVAIMFILAAAFDLVALWILPVCA
jgi:hypothetical protein